MKQGALKTTGFLLATLILAVSCAQYPMDAKAQSEDLPSWVNNPEEQFSDSKFLMAVGSSTSRQEAKNRAQSNIAKIFVSKVQVNESLIQEYEETSNSEGESSFSERSQLITRSRVESNQQMRNVQIKELHQAENGTFYALAAMNRMKTSQLYTEEINRNKKAISSLRQKAEQTDSRLERLIYMKQALAKARMNEMLLNQRAILSGQTTQASGDMASVSDITQAYRKAKQACTVSIKATSDNFPRELQSEISRKLQNEGFTISKVDEEPVVSMNVNLMMDPVDLGRENAEFVQWAFQVEAQNMQTGQWFSTYTAEGRSGSMNQKYARKRAIQAVQEKVSSDFSEFINNELLSVR